MPPAIPRNEHPGIRARTNSRSVLISLGTLSALSPFLSTSWVLSHSLRAAPSIDDAAANGDDLASSAHYSPPSSQCNILFVHVSIRVRTLTAPLIRLFVRSLDPWHTPRATTTSCLVAHWQSYLLLLPFELELSSDIVFRKLVLQ